MYQFKTIQQNPGPRLSNNRNPLIQPKLKVGQPGDKYEQEADRVAERVMKMSETNSVQMQPEEEEEKIQMQPLEEEEKLQMKCSSDNRDFAIQKMSPGNAGSVPVSDQIFNQIGSTKGNGKSLDGQTQSFMAGRFGGDFGNVKIHTDQTAVSLNRQLNAQAFTVGNDIYFNEGKYNPSGDAGRKLLAHELTHTIQQGGGIHPMIQKDENESSSGGGTPLADLVSGLVRDQLSNSGIRGHLSSLGTALQGLAVENTAGESDQPQQGAERLAALGISRAFEITSAAILRDPEFAALRQRIIEIVGSSDEVALIAALAAGLAAVLADVSVKGSPSRDLGAGFSVGGSFDFGSIQSLQFNNLQLYAQYANDYFRTRITGAVSRDAETEEFSGTGTGEVRIGSELSHLMGRVTINSDGEVVLAGRLSGGYRFGGSDRLVFTTDLTHTFETGETVIQPGVSGRFSLGHDQSLSLGTSLSVSSDEGLTGLTGFIEYRRNFLQLRIEGSMTGIPEERSMVPGSDMRIQGMLIIPLFP